MKAKSQIVVGLTLAALIVATAVTASFWSFGQMEKAAALRKHTFLILNRADDLLSALKDAEIGQRGYLLTGDEAFLEPYLAVRDSVAGQLNELRQLTLVAAAQQHLDALAPLIDARLTSLSIAIELYRNQGQAAALAAVSSGRGNRLMESIRAEMHSYIQIEEGALTRHDAAFQLNMHRLVIALVAGGVLLVVFALAVVYFIYRQSQQRLDTTGALQRAIFDSVNFSSIATDAKGVIQIFNAGAERMLGYTAAEVVNKMTPADISDPQEVIARAKALTVELATPITPGFEALVFKSTRTIEDIYELTYIRKNGSRIPAVVSVTALRDAKDAIIGYLLIGTDNTARKLVEAEQKKLDQRLRDQQFYTRSLIESNIDALMTTDPSGIITDVNKQMESLTGCTRDELIGAPFKSFFTDPERAEAGIKRVLSEKKVTDYELTARARDGKETVVSYNATTFYDRSRTLQGVFAAARDVTERKEVEAKLHFLMRELTHRTKNLLAVIQAMARQTARSAGSTESFLEKFNARLQALAASHDVLVQEEWLSATLADLVRMQLSPYLDRRAPQFSIEGPIVLLKPDAAQNLGFALHELATNAAKYGALSVPEGRVSIAWHWLPEAEGNGVELDWVESGGPAVVKPAQRGFGSMVIERNLADGLNTKVDLAFRAEGLQCKILLPPGQLVAIG
jgi:PAS domain S-box-containing protein